MNPNIPTPHINAPEGAFAPTVLMPGDPLRSKYIAENFLEDAVLVNNVRGVQGYTGTYQGKKVSVMASGMGMPSISIYSHELFNFYGVENIIRIGSAGAMTDKLHLRDIVAALSAYSDSSYATQYGFYGNAAPCCSYSLLSKAVEAGKEIGKELVCGSVYSSDMFYNEGQSSAALRKLNVLAVEMECAALYLNAARDMKDDQEKARLKGVKPGDVVTFNPAKAYADNATELASLLRISKEEAENMKADFSLQVSEILRFEPAKPDQELFDRVLGKDVVGSEEEFRQFIHDDIKRNFDSEAQYQFVQDLRKHILKRIGKVEFPETLLKRFMKLRNKDKGEEYVEENYEKSLPELLWHLAKEQICDQLGIKVEHDDVLETAKTYARMQFASYGMMNLPEESVTRYATEMLKNEQQAQGLVERTVENKLAAKAKETVTLKIKEVTIDEFRKLNED